MDIGLIDKLSYKNYLQSLKLNGRKDVSENFFTSVNEQIKNISQYDNSFKIGEKRSYVIWRYIIKLNCLHWELS